MLKVIHDIITKTILFKTWDSSNNYRPLNYIRTSRRINDTGLLTCVFLLLLISLTLAPLYFVTESIEAASSYTPSESAINITTGRETSGVDFSVSDSNGTFATNHGNNDDTNTNVAAFSVTTDNATGYNLSITADNGVNLTRNGGTEILAPINTTCNTNVTSGITSTQFNNSNCNNMWGYLPSYYNSNTNTGDNAKYYPITTSDATIEKTNSTKLSGTYTVALGVRADYTKPAGTYTNTIELTVVGNPINYSITYDKNLGTYTSDTVDNWPANQSGATSATYITLNNGASTTPTRTGYTFSGWCDGTTSVAANGTATCKNGTTYAKDDNFYFNAKTMNTTTLYALWTANNYTCTKQYRLENGDGSWGSYVTDTTEQVAYRNTCSYSKTLTDYKASASGTNNGTASTSGTMNSTSGLTLQLSLYRNTYAIQFFTDYTYISSASITTAAVHTKSGLPYYRWGQKINVSVTIKNGGELIYWYQVNDTSPEPLVSFNSPTSQNTYFTMIKADIDIDPWVDAPAMQTMASSSCTTTAKTVRDARDNERYLVQRLADGNCWMLDNLGFSDATYTMTSSDTNIASGTTYKFPNASGAWAESYTTAYINATNKHTTTTSYGKGSGRTGTFYNYCAASAGTYCYAEGAGVNNAEYDICPKGWRIPTGGSTGDFWELCTVIKGSSCADIGGLIPMTASDTASMQYQLSVPLSGYLNPSGSLIAQEGSGVLWTSTESGGSSMYFVAAHASDFTRNKGGVRTDGLSIRCIKVPNGYMQDVMADQLATLMPSEGSTTTLTDRRDAQEYSIAKINGNYWMTRNLAIGCNGSGSAYGSDYSSKTLNFSTSNISSSWSTPTAGTPYNDYAARMTCDSTYGAWYNFCAAAAGSTNSWTACSNSSYSGNNDICPAGWRLPTSSEFSSITSYKDMFSPVAGGFYMNNGSSPRNTYLGGYWSSTASGTSQYYMRYNESGIYVEVVALDQDKYRYGLYARCIRSS